MRVVSSLALGAEINCHNSLGTGLILLCGRTNKGDARLEILQMMLDASA